MTATARRIAAEDQYRAAVTDARRRLAAFAAAHGTRPPADTSGVAAWLNHVIADLNAALATGTVRRCPHIGPAPTVIHAAVWNRWHLACTGCLPALVPTDPAEENICDRCRQPAPVINPGSATAGPVLLAFGLCDPCATHTGTRHH